MKTIRMMTLAALACVVLGQASLALAADGARIAVVRVEHVIENSQFAKAQQKMINDSLEQQSRAIDLLQKQVAAEEQSLRSETLLDPNSARFRLKMLDLEKMKVELNDKIANLQKHHSLKMTEFWRSVYADFRAAVTALAKTGKYDLIITAAPTELSPDENMPISALLNEIMLLRRVQYVNPSIDVTDQVLQLMDKIYQQRG